MKQFSSYNPHWRESQTQEHEFQEIGFIKSCLPTTNLLRQQLSSFTKLGATLSFFGTIKNFRANFELSFFPIKRHSRLWGSLVSSTLKINADFDHFPCFHHYHPGLRPHTLSLDDWKSLLIGVSAFVLTHYVYSLHRSQRDPCKTEISHIILFKISFDFPFNSK